MTDAVVMGRHIFRFDLEPDDETIDIFAFLPNPVKLMIAFPKLTTVHWTPTKCYLQDNAIITEKPQNCNCGWNQNIKESSWRSDEKFLVRRAQKTVNKK